MKNYRYSQIKPGQTLDNQISMGKDSEDDCFDVSLADYQREYFTTNPSKQTRVTSMFRKALIKLRGFRMWLAMLQDIRLYGTGCTLFDADDLYKRHIKNIMTEKVLANLTDIPKMNKGSWWVFKMNGRCLYWWNFLLFVFILYSIFLLPYFVAFKDFSAGSYYKFEVFVDVFFACDILISLNSEYSLKSSIIKNNKDIIKSYIRNNYFTDFLILFPFFLLTESNSPVRLIKVLRSVKLKKFIQTISKYFEHSATLNSYQGLTRLIAGMVIVIIMIHLVSCIWFISSRFYNFSQDTWVFRFNFLDKSEGSLYLAGFYWACTVLTTVGYGDIYPFTVFEILVAIFWMICGIGFYSLVVGSLSSVLSSFDQQSEGIRSKLDMLELFIKNTQLPDEKGTELRKAFQQQLEKLNLDYAERVSLVSSLSKNLRYKVCMAMYNNAARKIDFFIEKKKKNKFFLYDIIPRLHHILYEKYKTVYKKDRYADEMYFLVEGRVSYIYGQYRLSFKDIIRGSYFGEIELLENIPREFTAVALQKSDMLILKKDDFKYMMDQYPVIAREIKETAAERRNRNNKAKGEIIDILEIVEIKKISTYEELAGTPYEPKPPVKFKSNMLTDKSEDAEKYLDELCRHVNLKFDKLEESLEKINKLFLSKN